MRPLLVVVVEVELVEVGVGAVGVEVDAGFDAGVEDAQRFFKERLLPAAEAVGAAAPPAPQSGASTPTRRRP